MSALGFIRTQAAATLPSPVALAEVQLRVWDTFAVGRRLWVRGRLLNLPRPSPAPARFPGWWTSWRTKPGPPAAVPIIQLETQIAGQVLKADVPLGPQGEFEAPFTVELPPARRGWRVARNQVTYAGQTLAGCSLVVAPPTPAGAVVVLLPRDQTLHSDGMQRLACSTYAARLAPQLQRLHGGSQGGHVISYLAGVSPTSDGAPAELALATTALGWPTGHFVLLPTDAETAGGAFALALDRLRWLFADASLFLVINLDPAARPQVDGLAPAADRASVTSLVIAPDIPEVRPALVAELARDRGPALRPSRAGRVTRYPLVFCHGMLACSMMRMQIAPDFNYFMPMRRFLEDRGFRVLFPRVTPTGGVVERAKQLREQIRAWTQEPVNLIAHSMGGLDARYLISHLDMADHVKTLTTVSTPHHGSYMADWFIQNFRQRVPLLVALEAMGISVDGFRDCRPAICHNFNLNTLNAPQVRYFSYAGEVPLGKVTPMLRRAWDLLTPIEGPNDGLVSVQSARWGEYLGAIHADHFAQTPDGLFVHPEEDFDALGFFTRVVEDLARRGY